MTDPSLETPELAQAEGEPPRYRSVRRLAGWVTILGVVAGLVVGFAVGYAVGSQVDGRAAQYVVGAAVGLLAGAVTITPYLVVVAVLELLTDVSEGVSWLTGFFYETRPDETLTAAVSGSPSNAEGR
jgi:hypothetical protein